MNNLMWTEKFRPKLLADYVFRDTNQQNTINKWVEDGIIPHLLFSGSPGVGKCLGGDEIINVKIDISTLSPSQIDKLKKYIK